ncbi:SGNH/GDSL hydrolase family protein [Enterococcus alcedinis]|uniref:Lipase n=1 Tax=Enterococcus alcedinis TaxID=1274384 RepID=A0A917JDT3_9ENTE|nr:SGNH/GDSL hydrolase family protein [Enterococcus alcedinis]MBP2101816.1 lysophospholipase L1-like esterase [Enterococcus alcedinis]GGI65378.1 lipase [Enterococcus alcedinis]
MTLGKKSRLLFVGDSITDSNRNYEAIPAGWSSFGDGYVNLINAYTTALLPDKEYMVVNKGVSGDTIVDLKSRWQQDVLDFKPDTVTIMIGINDVWRHFDGTFCQSEFVHPTVFEQVYRELIEETLAKGIKVFLMSPFMVEANHQDPMRSMVDDYRSIVKKLSEKYQLVHGDVQKKIDQFLKYQSSYVLSSDRVHVSLAGHLLIVQEWLEMTKIIENEV